MRKIGSASSPSIQKRGSWGSSKRPQLTLHPNPNFLTIYTEERLVGKTGLASSPSIQKKGS